MSLNDLSEIFIDHHLDHTTRHNKMSTVMNNDSPNNGTDNFIKPSLPISSNRKQGYNKNNGIKKLSKDKKLKDKWDINGIFQNNMDSILSRQNNAAIGNNNNKKITMVKMNKKLVDNVMKLIEGNLQDSIDNAFNNNLPRLNMLLQNDQSEIDQIYHWKIKLINEILNKIESRLNVCEIPTDLNANDLDPEYIFNKRNYIQSLLQDSLTHKNELHLMKTELNNKITDMENFVKSMSLNNTYLLQQKLLNNNLHPILNRAVDNSFGLIKDTKDYLVRDRARYNLYIPDDVNKFGGKYNNPDSFLHKISTNGNDGEKTNENKKESNINDSDKNTDLEEIMKNLLPSLKDKEIVETKLNDTLIKFLNDDATKKLSNLLKK